MPAADGSIRNWPMPSKQPQHLSVRVDQEFGMPPKLLARIVRFDRAMRIVRLGELTSWSISPRNVAPIGHMAREFVAFTGDPPTALLRRRLPDEGGFLG